MSYKYQVSKPSITQEDIDAVNKTLKEGYVSHAGPVVSEFENTFADVSSMKYGVSCNSGTNALYLALKALGVGKGDEVIVPEFTMIATAYAVSYTGARPVFVDCDHDLNIDVEKIEKKISKRTKVILPVHIYGKLCDMKQIQRIAYAYDLKVVEDCAEIAPGIHQSLADICCYSLFANKIITTGEGGMCVTDSPQLAEKMRYYANMAFNEDHTFSHAEIGYNFRMTSMQAALGLSQLRRLNKILDKRKKIERWYNQHLDFDSQKDVLWMYNIYAHERDQLRFHLEKNGVESRVVFKPMSMQPPYLGKYKHLEAYRASLRGLYLPTYTDLEESDVKYISEVVKSM